jgi:hypothetical protein
MTLFLLASAIAFLAGAAALLSPKASIALFLGLLVVMPSGHYFKELNSFSGIYFFDLFLPGAITAIALRTFLRGREKAAKVRVSVVGKAFAIAVLISIPYFALGVFDTVDKFYLRDLRPLMIMGLSYAFYLVVAEIKGGIDLRWTLWFVTASASLVVLKYALSLTGFQSTEDVFYIEGTYRYLDAGTYIAAAYILWFLVVHEALGSHPRLAKAAFVLSLAVLVISNSRFLVLSTALAAFFISGTSLKKRMAVIALVVSSAGFLLAVSYYLGIERVSGSLSSDAIGDQLSVRYGPALYKIAEMSDLQLLVGSGVGTTFDIPWFLYRGLDTRSISIDGAYLTYFVKYGLFGLLLLWCFIETASAGARDRLGVPITAMLAFMSVVSSTAYQPYAVGIGVAMIVFRASNVAVRPSAQRSG